tara:strand:+ start:305 stop:550 length:246 start_codon:yes stop_codon:yes gene_type:complete
MSKKERTMDQYRQSKEYRENPWSLYGSPHIGSEGEIIPDHDVSDNDSLPTTNNDLYIKLKELRKQYPNNQEFGAQVAKRLL